MRIAILSLFLAISSWASPGPADAQKWNDPSKSETRKDLLTVESFGPKAVSIGTAVTIQGKGFSLKTQILVGGRPVKPTRVQTTALVFKVPAGHGDGMIVLRHPGVARDIRVGQLSIATNARITQFSPQSGIRGSRVQISGSGFKRGDRVMMNGKDIKVNRSAPKRLVVTIPANANTDYLTLVAKDGGLVRTSSMFRVRLPAPTIASFAPASGVPGTLVRVTGTNLTVEDQVFLGKTKLTVKERGADFVTVSIPKKAKTSAFLMVRNPNGEARATSRFQVHKVAVIKGISPRSGKGGDTVTIRGSGFLAGDLVTMNGTALKIAQLRPGQITVQVPANAETGQFTVERGPMKVLSKQAFEILRAPVVHGFTPEGGRPGARVTITGKHFTRDSNVYYGAKKLRIIKRTKDTALLVKLPARSDAQVLRVRNKAGEAHASKPFEIRRAAIVSSLTPREGFPGATLTLTGKHMRSVEAVWLGTTELTVTSRAPDKVTVSVPLGATSGRIKVRTTGKNKLSRLRFKVLPGPLVNLFTPQSGPPGVELVVEGQNIFPDTRLFLGDTLLVATAVTQDRITARVPTTMASGSYVLRLSSGLSESQSASKFQVVAPAEIASFEPDRVSAGSKVKLLGKNFDMSTKVYWGPLLLQVIHAGPLGNTLIVRIPKNTVGARYLIVDSGGVRARSREMLEVLTPQRRKR